MYCELLQLLESVGSRELAQIATPDRARVVDDALMDATLRGTDRSAFNDADIVVADEALARIARALEDADQMIDGFLRVRKPVPYTVPLSTVPGIVTQWARAIARYNLHNRDSASGSSSAAIEAGDPVLRDYRDAQKFLQLAADGKFSLGGDDPLPPAGGGMPAICQPARTFPEGSLDDFTRGYGTR